jgi:hypothetical protein
VTLHLPDDDNPSLEDGQMVRDIHALKEELDAAGAHRWFSIVEADMDEALV